MVVCSTEQNTVKKRLISILRKLVGQKASQAAGGSGGGKGRASAQIPCPGNDIILGVCLPDTSTGHVPAESPLCASPLCVTSH